MYVSYFQNSQLIADNKYFIKYYKLETKCVCT